MATALTTLVLSQAIGAMIASQRLLEAIMADVELSLQSRSLREKLLYHVNEDGGLMAASKSDLSFLNENKGWGNGIEFKPRKGPKNRIVLGTDKRLKADKGKQKWLCSTRIPRQAWVAAAKRAPCCRTRRSTNAGSRPDKTVKANSKKDMLGLVANGNYTVHDGGQKVNYVYDAKTKTYLPSGTVNRKYDESAVGDQVIKDRVSSSDITQIDAVLYNNHAVMGRIGQCQFNGALISRDEGIIYRNSVRFNWDIRLGSRSPDGCGTA